LNEWDAACVAVEFFGSVQATELSARRVPGLVRSHTFLDEVIDFLLQMEL